MKILYATDGRIPAEAAGVLLRELADPDRVAVDVITVTASTVREPWLVSRRTDEREVIEHAQLVRDDAVDELRRRGFAAGGRVLRGVAAHEIEREAADHDLVVLGASAKRWVDRLVLGSVSRHVLHTSTTPVLVVHAAPIDRRARVLVATDGSVDARHAVDTFRRFADPRRCDVEVVSVATADVGALAMAGIGGPVEAVTLDMRAAVEAAHAAADLAVSTLAEDGFNAHPTVLEGPATVRLLDEAAASNVDLVVVGSRGLGPVGRVVLGSVSEAIVHHTRAALVGRLHDRAAGSDS
jgi:nucleotide-binding universal stress UspA family protein